MTAAVILAAGRGERVGRQKDKAFLSLGPVPLVVYSLLAFQACIEIGSIILVVGKDYIETANELCLKYGIEKLLRIVAGGESRQESVRIGLSVLPEDCAEVAIHDSARPLVTPELITATVLSARQFGSGVAAHKIVDTIKTADADCFISSTVDRSKLWAVETPQTFKTDILLRAHDAVSVNNETVTDDAGALEYIGEKVKLVEWRKPNLKVTYADDFVIAEKLLGI